MSDTEHSLGKGVRTTSGLTLVSRIFGLARDLVTVRIFADTAIGSAFAAAFMVPNLFRRLFGEGALSAAFLPSYAQLLESDEDKAHAFSSLVVASLTLLTGALTLLLEAVLLAVLL
ncbi:MAG: lipid II flippase MurJ, partial [Planctomycetota bacterium]